MHRPRLWPRWSVFFIILTCLAGVATSLALFRARRVWERAALEEAFQAQAASLAQALERERLLSMELVESLGRLHALSADVSRRTFDEFVNMGLVYHREKLGVFGWAPRVRGADRARYEEAMRAIGNPRFEIVERSGERWVPAQTRADYFPVSYVVPPDHAELPLGLDLASLAAARDALRRASEGGLPILTGPLDLGGRERPPARWLLAPIFPRRAMPGRLAAGFVVVAVDFKRLFGPLIENGNPDALDAWVFDRAEGGGEASLLYPFPSGREGLTYTEAWNRLEREGRPTARFTLTIGGEAWLLLCAPSPGMMRAFRTWQPWALLGGGLALTLLLTLQLALLAGRARKVERLVDLRTRELRHANESLRHEMVERMRLEQEVLEAGSREARRIGQDLHDSLGQKLTGVSLLSRTLARKLEQAAAPQSEDAAHIVRLLREAIAQVRRMARGLAPVDLGGESLAGALRRLAEDIESQTGVRCVVDSEDWALPSPMADNLYHIAQEALTNAVRHGRASSIVIRLRADGERGVLSVADDGVGLPPAGAHGEGMGLRIMRYRAEMIGGELRVQKAGEGGVEVRCSFDRAP